MGWVRYDDDFYDHPKWIEAGPLGISLGIIATAWCNRNLTDGKIPTAKVKTLCAFDGLEDEGQPVTAVGIADRLVEVGLWHAVPGGYEIHDYLDFQPSRAQVQEKNALAAHRAALRADRDLVREIRARDGNRCRYCGRRVDWTDRKSAKGGTYDHVIPRGPNTAENVVVACRGCNSKKGARPLAESGMTLLPVGSASDQDQETEQIHTRSSPDIRSTQPQPQVDEPNGSSRGAANRGLTALPADFALTSDMRLWAAENAPLVDVVHETKRFIAWANSRNKRYKDWRQTWDNWMLRVQGENAQHQGNRRDPNANQNRIKRIVGEMHGLVTTGSELERASQ